MLRWLRELGDKGGVRGEGEWGKGVRVHDQIEAHCTSCTEVRCHCVSTAFSLTFTPAIYEMCPDLKHHESQEARLGQTALVPDNRGNVRPLT